MFSIIKNYLFIAFFGGLSILAMAFFVSALIYPTLPNISHLEKYRPKQPLQIFSKEGILIAEFGEERRDFIAISDTPQQMINAILSIEDRRFFEHPGIDFIGITRAAIKNILGKSHEGASTITMQVARNFFLTSEKTFKRKINEILLAIKIERTLSKEEILELYVNQIYLGQRSFGFAAAANTYFGKNLDQLNLGETALLAGLPKAPSRYNPLVRPNLAINRQQNVLNSMLRHGYIDKPTYIIALEDPLSLKDKFMKSELQANYVAEMVRQTLFEEFGDKIYTSGLKVFTTIKKKNQLMANKAVQNGIINYMARHDLAPPEDFIGFKSKEFKTNKERDKFLLNKLKLIPTYNNFIPGVILDLQPLRVDVLLKNGKKISVYKRGLKLLKKDLELQNDGEKLLKPGSVIRFVKKRNFWIATQLPEVESSLVSMDPKTGAILALVGGFDFHRNKYNHVSQANRQPGSIFKPFIYSAALEKGITPATLVNDAPIYVTAAELNTNENWEPQNYNEKYDGAIRLRQGLAKSKNLVAIRVLKHIDPKYALDYITRFGFDKKKHSPYLSMALGVGQVTALEMVAAYGVFANGGYLKKPYFIEKIIDVKGRKIKQNFSVTNEETPRIIDPRNAFIMTSLLQEVINTGTARKAKRLKREDIAGKTGTTNELVDAWFAGFNPDIVTVTWMGFDQPRTLGKHESGSRAALPIWIDYMRPIINEYPTKILESPYGIIPLRINPKNGMLAKKDEDGIFEYFYDEFLPNNNAYYLLN
ncbi:MAG: penicillin-binding protein 1A [Nitrosomonadales bacterium]|nr:penicillin-binding protein 1A [Nitrosomonadales bacterium]MAS00496.1 penicillin-binding protein 1A [Nitrosomonadales bacterium]|tara:strand:+ start:78 stop:2363 length:2286 start_codon:yes stop_codon:yes gene_type:complete